MARHDRGLLLALAVTALVGGAFAAVTSASSPVLANPSTKPTAPSVTSGGNGALVWSEIHRDALGEVDGGRLNAGGYAYFPADPGTAPRDPEWSPDGNEIAYAAYTMTYGQAGIWTVGQPFHSHTTPRQLTTIRYDTDPTWSPDGTTIAFARATESVSRGIYLIDVDGGTPRHVFTDSGFFGDDLAWSPDGRTIAYANPCCGDGTVKHIYTVDLDGGDPVDLGPGLSPSWKPDGSKIAFEYVYSSSDHDIYQMNPDGTGRSGLQTGTVSDEEPVWSPDGEQIAFHRSGGIYTWSLSGGSVVQVDTYGAEVESTTWGPKQTVCQGRATTISGTVGADTLRGSNGVDVINGLAGNDTIIGLQGKDVICGGPGNDTVSYAGQSTPATAIIGETDPSATVSDLISADVENLIGGSGPDTLVGDDRANALVGGADDDRIRGLGGNDSVDGAAGDDELYGGSGDDLLVGGDDADWLGGGPGEDTADYTGRAQPVNVTVGDTPRNDGGKVDGTLSDRDTVTGSIEDVFGGNGADTLVGSEADNQLRGGIGADWLYGGAGRDLLRAQDNVADHVIDCGADTDSPAIKDAIDPAPISCP